MTKRSVSLPFGMGYIKCKLSERNSITVLEPEPLKVIKDPSKFLFQALESPVGVPSISELASDAKNVSIVISDSTRPTPSGLIIKGVLQSLYDSDIKKDHIKLIVATGLHRPCTRVELIEKLGINILDDFELIQHNARNSEDLIYLGETSRCTPIMVNKAVFDSDLIIGDGYIEPHFFAGYTGGGKNIIPGVAGIETIKKNHGAIMIDHPEARAGILKGNPIYEDIIEGADIAGFDFSINVILNQEKHVSGIFAGEFKEAHLQGANFLDNYVKINATEADIVITTNGGYPLDRNLYQAVKGIYVADAAVRAGGVIIIASECRDGIGHPDFYSLFKDSENPQEVLKKIREPDFFQIDQWQAQILARILERNYVIFVTEKISSTAIEEMHMTAARDINVALEKTKSYVGRDPRITIIPGGPSIIPISE